VRNREITILELCALKAVIGRVDSRREIGA